MKFRQFRIKWLSVTIYHKSPFLINTRSVETCKHSITKDMLSRGLNCIEYANGARHTLPDYADMAIWTASKRAYLQGEGEKRQEWGISTADDAWTKEELEAIGQNYEAEQRQQYAERKAEKYGRLSEYSLDPENRKKYAAKVQGWKAIAKEGNSDIIKSVSTGEEALMTEIHSLGKINTEVLEKEFGNIQTDEIIVTNERIEHIKERHPEDYALFEKYGKESVASPDLIIKDVKNKGTVFMVKRLPETNLNVVVRVVLETDDSKLKNSVMTFYRIRERNLRKLVEKNGLLYKKE